MSGPDAGLPRENRLTHASEFARVFEQPLRSGDQYFTVLYRTTDGGCARLGLAVSKKRMRRAVDRNRVKRLIKESFRLHRSELGSTDVVVMARRDLRSDDNRDLFASLQRHWQRLKIT